MGASAVCRALSGDQPLARDGCMIAQEYNVFDEEFAAWFWAKVDTTAGPDGCWYYGNTTAPSNSERSGYTGVYRDGRAVGTAHRIACILAHGPVPDGYIVMHSCDNPPCCNPAHLRTGTYAENARDRQQRGRQRGGPYWCHGHGGDL